MTAPAGLPSLAKLAEIYPVSRQRLHQVARQYGRKTLLCPDELAAVMLPDVFRSQKGDLLIDLLKNPGERIRVAAELRQLQF